MCEANDNLVKPRTSPKTPEVSISYKCCVRHKDNNVTENLMDLNSHLNLFDNDGSRFEGMDEILKSFQEGKLLYPVFFEKVQDLTLSQSKFQITSFIDFEPYLHIFKKLKRYSISLINDLTEYAEIDTFPLLLT